MGIVALIPPSCSTFQHRWFPQTVRSDPCQASIWFSRCDNCACISSAARSLNERWLVVVSKHLGEVSVSSSPPLHTHRAIPASWRSSKRSLEMKWGGSLKVQIVPDLLFMCSWRFALFFAHSSLILCPRTMQRGSRRSRRILQASWLHSSKVLLDPRARTEPQVPLESPVLQVLKVGAQSCWTVVYQLEITLLTSYRSERLVRHH